MFDIAASALKKRFLTFKNFLWLFSIFIFIQFLDELLETIDGISLENTSWDYIFDGFQVMVMGTAIYFFLKYIENHSRNSQLKDSFLRAVIENMDEGVAVCDKDGNLVFMNDPSSKLLNTQHTFSFPVPVKMWSHYWDVFDIDKKSKVKGENLPLLKALKGEIVKNQVIVVKPSGNQAQYFSINGKQLKSKAGDIIGALVVLHDITEQKENEEKIKFMAFHDPLTGLANLRLFKDKVAQFLPEGKQHIPPKKLAVMFLDLDGFKTINDHYGHDIGDLLLKEVSQRIKSCLGENGLVARIGGDEFTILLPDIKTENDALAVANKMIERISSPCEIKGNRLQVTTSLGISMSPQDGTDRRTLMKNADIAMYTAKGNGKNQYCVFGQIANQV